MTGAVISQNAAYFDFIADICNPICNYVRRKNNILDGRGK